MRARIVSMLFSFLILSGCGGVRVLGLVNGGSPFLWNGQIVSPGATTIIVPPGSTVIVIIEVVPVNGFFITGNQFINAFNAANPNLFFCPSVVSVANSGLLFPDPFANPSIGLTITPSGLGNCAIPLNLGESGIVTLNVTVH
jgi:hypothetical protein